MHKLKKIHGDLQPQNMLVVIRGTNMTAKISDFSISNTREFFFLLSFFDPRAEPIYCPILQLASKIVKLVTCLALAA